MLEKFVWYHIDELKSADSLNADRDQALMTRCGIDSSGRLMPTDDVKWVNFTPLLTSQKLGEIMEQSDVWIMNKGPKMSKNSRRYCNFGVMTV